MAVLDRPWWHRAARLTLLVLNNLLPWRWATARGEWFGPSPLPPLAATATAIAIGLGATAGAYLANTGGARPGDEAPVATRLRLWLLCVAFTVLANATFMSVQGAYLYYRTNLHSRVWASLALAMALDALARRSRRAAWTAAAVAVLFLAGGIAGGREHRDLLSRRVDAASRRAELARRSHAGAAGAARPGPATAFRHGPWQRRCPTWPATGRAC